MAESAAAIETMVHRLDSGRWGSTAPEDLIQLAATLDDSSPARFVAFEPYAVKEYNRTWLPK